MSSSDHPAITGVDLVKFFKSAFSQDPKKEFVWETTLLFLRRNRPFVDHDPLDASNGFLFGYTGIGNPVQMATKQFFFLLRS